MEEGDRAETGRAAVDRLVKEHRVQAITGVASSAVMSGIRDQVEAAEVPLVGSNASPSSLGSVKYIWRTSYVNNEAGRALGGYLATRKSLPAYVISDNSPTSREVVSGFLSAYHGTPNRPALADDPVQVPMVSTSGLSLTSYLNAIRSSGARAVFASFAPETVATFVRAYRAAGLTAALYAPGFASEGANALHDLGDAAGGIYTAMNYAPDLDNGANRTFASEYQKRYSTPPSTYAMASYDAAAVLDKALQLAGGDLTPQSVNSALSGIGQIDSPRGWWQFNQSRTPFQRWYLRQVRKAGQVLTNTMLTDLAMLG
jgi:branched-chain amino acid transport system substrate-binding protein